MIKSKVPKSSAQKVKLKARRYMAPEWTMLRHDKLCLYKGHEKVPIYYELPQKEIQIEAHMQLVSLPLTYFIKFA